jgi:hypothetical protein
MRGTRGSGGAHENVCNFVSGYPFQLHPGCGSKRLWSGVPLYDFRRVGACQAEADVADWRQFAGAFRSDGIGNCDRAQVTTSADVRPDFSWSGQPVAMFGYRQACDDP